MHVRKPEVLFEEICRVAVVYGQFRMAWIGLVDETDGLLKPVYFAGEEQGYLANIRIKYADESLGRDPTSTSIREGHCIICQNIATDPVMEPWREQALQRGYGSLAAVPFRRQGRIVGALTVYAAEPNGFDIDAENLLDKIGGDISFALDSMDIEIRQNQTEILLSESETRYHQLLNVAPIAIAVHSEGKLVFANPAGAKLLGANSPKELIGKPINEIIHPDHWAAAKNRIQRMLNGDQGLYPTEENYIRLDGSTIQVEVIAAPLTYNEKPAVQVIVIDITERKRAEVALIESENRLRAIVESEPECVKLLDINGKLLDMNPAGLAMIEADSLEQVTGALMYSLVVPEHQAAFKGLHKRIFEGETGILEFEMVGLKGTRRFMETHAVPLRNAQGDITSLLGVARDITERKKAEHRIADQLKHLKALHTVDTAIASNFDLRVTIETLLEQLTSQLRVDVASICLFDKYMLTLEHMASIGFYSPPAHGSTSKIAKSLAESAITERRAIHIPDLSQAELDPVNAYRYRSEKFVSYYVVPLISKGHIQGVMEIFQRTPLQATPEWQDFADNMAGQAAIAIDNSRLLSDLQKSNMELALAYDATIEGWSRAMDLRDKDTKDHTLRVTEITMQLADRLGLSQEEKIKLRRGALLHDIGKLGISDSILLRPGKLTDEEWVIMRQHPTLAYNMLLPIDYLGPSLDIPYCHHEKWDGTGYPRGLKGEQIPLGARIFAVVDVWDALRSDRPYRAAWSEKQTLDYIHEQSGKHFDPHIADVFLHMVTKS